MQNKFFKKTELIADVQEPDLVHSSGGNTSITYFIHCEMTADISRLLLLLA